MLARQGSSKRAREDEQVHILPPKSRSRMARFEVHSRLLTTELISGAFPTLLLVRDTVNAACYAVTVYGSTGAIRLLLTERHADPYYLQWDGSEVKPGSLDEVLELETLFGEEVVASPTIAQAADMQATWLRENRGKLVVVRLDGEEYRIHKQPVAVVAPLVSAAVFEIVHKYNAMLQHAYPEYELVLTNTFKLPVTRLAVANVTYDFVALALIDTAEKACVASMQLAAQPGKLVVGYFAAQVSSRARQFFRLLCALTILIQHTSLGSVELSVREPKHAWLVWKNYETVDDMQTDEQFAEFIGNEVREQGDAPVVTYDLFVKYFTSHSVLRVQVDTHRVLTDTSAKNQLTRLLQGACPASRL